ncbi:MAG: hypothetical protein ACK5LK_08460 [Chthoniobacterales bacterium]
MNFDQGEFDFSTTDDEAGYRDWKQRLDDQKHHLEHHWGIRLGVRVRIQLVGIIKPIEGVIRLDHSYNPIAHKPPRLLIDNLSFFPNEIESLNTTDDNHINE